MELVRQQSRTPQKFVIDVKIMLHAAPETVSLAVLKNAVPSDILTPEKPLA
jgi:hypothetical protein